MYLAILALDQSSQVKFGIIFIVGCVLLLIALAGIVLRNKLASSGNKKTKLHGTLSKSEAVARLKMAEARYKTAEEALDRMGKQLKASEEATLELRQQREKAVKAEQALGERVKMLENLLGGADAKCKILETGMQELRAELQMKEGEFEKAEDLSNKRALFLKRIADYSQKLLSELTEEPDEQKPLEEYLPSDTSLVSDMIFLDNGEPPCQQ